MSCLALSCLVLSCLVLSCIVLSCLVLSCLVLSCLVLSCLALSCLVVARRPGLPLVAVFVGVRLVRRGLQGNVLLSEIYVLALSEPPLQGVSSEKDAQSCPETDISSLVRGKGFRSRRINKIQQHRRLRIKVRSKLRGFFSLSFSTCLQRGASILDACA